MLIDGRIVNDVPGSQRGIGFVFQNYALFKYMTVYDNIAFGLEIQKRDKQYIQQLGGGAAQLDQSGGGWESAIQSALRRSAAEGGVCPRHCAQPAPAAAGRAFAAIDAKVRKDLRAWLRHTISRLGVTSIFVTHDQEEAIEVADEIVVTNKGRIEQVGTPVEICMNPKTPFVAQFIGRGTIVSNIRAFSGFAHAPVGACGGTAGVCACLFM